MFQCFKIIYIYRLVVKYNEMDTELTSGSLNSDWFFNYSLQYLSIIGDLVLFITKLCNN